MQTTEPTQGNKKNYQSPVLKDLGKIGEVTNSTSSDSSHAQDGGSSPNYYS